MAAIRVILVDDHNLVRAGIRSLLSNIPSVEIVAEAGSGQDALRLISDKHPHIVLMDISLPDMTGLDVAKRVYEELQLSDVKILFLSMYANEEYVWQAMQIGAAGYLLKDASTNEFELAFQSVARGEAYLSPEISRRVIDGYVKRVSTGNQENNAGESSAAKLSVRQNEVLRLIAEGFTTKEIAMNLGLSVKTVEAHRTQLMRELEIHDIAGLVRYAIRIGLVSAE